LPGKKPFWANKCRCSVNRKNEENHEVKIVWLRKQDSNRCTLGLQRCPIGAAFRASSFRIQQPPGRHSRIPSDSFGQNIAAQRLVAGESPFCASKPGKLRVQRGHGLGSTFAGRRALRHGRRLCPHQGAAGALVAPVGSAAPRSEKAQLHRSLIEKPYTGHLPGS
jgi:hypothetical protein